MDWLVPTACAVGCILPPLRGCDGLCVASAFSLAPTVPSYASFSGCTSFSWFPGFSLTQPLHGCARALLCPGLCCAQGFLVERPFRCTGFLVVKERIADLTATSILSRGVKRLFTVIAHASQATLQGHRGLQPARADLGCRPAEWIT